MGTLKLLILTATATSLLSAPWLGTAIRSGADVAVARPDSITELEAIGAALGLSDEAGAWVIVFDDPSAVEPSAEEQSAEAAASGIIKRAR